MPEIIEFSKLTDAEIKEILKKNKIGLTVSEARKIEEILGRPPTMTEAVLWGIQGSEHCSYKSSKEYLKMLPTKAPNVILGPSEDAGIIELANIEGERYGIVVAHESHNHPSQIVPYEGAATGIGGIVRDVACMGAKVIAVMDPLRFGDIKRNQSRLIAEGVTDGVGGYGNPIGIPNLGGDAYFDEGYNDNCLVNVVALGLVKESEIIHSYVPEEAADVGYDIIIIGKPTDNSGMGGASFASEKLDESEKESKSGAVQEPNPFLKRHLLVSTYDLFKIIKEKGYLDKVSFKDHGAGGNVCSTVEQLAKWNFGADIDIEKLHVGMKDLHPSVIACSETQERFAWVCHPDVTQLILDHYNKKWELPLIAENARASLVGKVRKGKYTLWNGEEKLCDAEALDITEGLQYERPFSKPEKDLKEPEIQEKDNYNDELLKLLASENIACRKPIYEKYDKQVRGDTIIDAGQADAGVMAPLLGEDVDEKYKKIGFAISADGKGSYGKIDPYYQSMNAVVESMRNVAAVGGFPICLTDCLNYGNPEVPEQMWEFIEGVKGITEACNNIHLKHYKDSPTPIISGNVSLYNQSSNGSIPPSAIISCVGRVDDTNKCTTFKFKGKGNPVYLLGKRKDELGGSEYYRLHGHLGKNVPKPDLEEAEKQIFAVSDAVMEGTVNSCHDISDGGIAITLAEMICGGCADGDIGVSVEMPSESYEQGLELFKVLFSETGGFVLEINKEKEEEFKAICEKYGVQELYKIGETTENDNFEMTLDGKKIISASGRDIKDKWFNGLREAF